MPHTGQSPQGATVDKNLSALLVIIFLFLVLGLMVWGWMSRRRRQAHLPALAPVPADVGEVFGTFDGLYVATSAAANPLDRIAVRGLGFRSRVRITVASEGVVLAIPGQPDSFIPVAVITGSGRATWSIDRVVEDNGLSTISWNLGDTAVASSFRLEHADEFADATRRLTISPVESNASDTL
jgi:hypothetical protein